MDMKNQREQQDQSMNFLQGPNDILTKQVIEVTSTQDSFLRLTTTALNNSLQEHGKHHQDDTTRDHILSIHSILSTLNILKILSNLPTTQLPACTNNQSIFTKGETSDQGNGNNHCPGELLWQNIISDKILNN
eukprot:GFUD01122925.1.p2 GENE.GFUD01122925.1~~GFUD01122925.1.p2  ORF type:complete len:133 (+),score=23.53 GFUD01122925.1:134-532(+)